MSAYVPKVGDRVRVTPDAVEGVVTAARRGDFTVSTDDGGHTWGDLRDLTVERLPDPEPEWAPGDVGRCEHNYTYLRTVSGRWVNMEGEVSGNSTCPRTPLVLNGKPVSA